MGGLSTSRGEDITNDMGPNETSSDSGHGRSSVRFVGLNSKGLREEGYHLRCAKLVLVYHFFPLQNKPPNLGVVAVTPAFSSILSRPDV